MDDTTKKLKLIVSDFHLGTGTRLASGRLNVMEDFLHDHRFKEFLEFYVTGKYADHNVELIFNGDMLNLIQVDYRGHYTAIITETVSSEKIRSVIKGHPVFFNALKAFLAKPGNTMTYIIGNHDQELMWPRCREIFEEAVGSVIQWKNIFYQDDGVYIEHGHQYEAINRVDPTLPFLAKNLNEPILNLPWGTLFTVNYLIRLKKQRPYIDKVRPFRSIIWWTLIHDFWGTMSSVFRLIMYFLSTRFSKNRYRHSNFKMTLKMLLEASVFPDLSDAAKRILRDPEIHTVVFGHTHVYRQLIIGEGKQYINTGSWTDIVSLDLESFARRTKLTYVRVEYNEEGQTIPLLRHWIGTIPLEDDAMGF